MSNGEDTAPPEERRKPTITDSDAPFVNRLRILCGYIENATDTVVRVFQDDATREWVVRIGNDAANKWYHGRSLEQAFEAAFQDPKNDPFR